MRQHGGFDDRQHRVAGVAARRHQRRQRGRVGLRRVLQRQRQIEQLFEAEHAGGVDQIVRLNARGGADMPFDEATLVEKFIENTRTIFPVMASYAEPILNARNGLDAMAWRDLVELMVEVPA